MLTDLKGEMDYNTEVVIDFNSPLSAINTSSRQKINKETSDLKCNPDQINLIDIYRTFHLTAAEYILFLTAHGRTHSPGHFMLGETLYYLASKHAKKLS